MSHDINNKENHEDYDPGYISKYKGLSQEFIIIFESIVEGIVVTDRKGNIVLLNSSAMDMIGCSYEVIGRELEEIFNIVNEETGSPVDNPVEKVLETGETQGLANHTVLITKDGHEKAIADSASPVIDPDSGLIKGVVMVFRDVSQERELRKSLEESERKYRALFENTGAASCLLDNDTTIRLANKKMEELTGYKKEEIEGKMSWKSLVANRKDLKKMLKYHKARREINNYAPGNYEFVLRDREGKQRDVLATVDIIENSSRSVASFTDVTRLKEVEKDLQDKISSLNLMVDGVINALGSTVKIRDSYTYKHQKGVARLAVAIAEKMGMSEEEYKGLYLAALIHDVGKIKVPVEILTKNARLTELEFEIIKTHPEAGFDILSNIEFPWPIAEIVKQHHEKIDGSGYPQGLVGSDILLESRIITVADVVEAMSSHRPYRPALGIDTALEEIRENCGILYDSKVVNACFDVFEENSVFT